MTSTVPAPATDSASPGLCATLFAGPGEMRARCRAFDWGSSPLGPVDGWSHSLRTIVTTILESRHPMFLWWGPELVQLYNDAYRPSFGEHGRHPDALGMRGRECWTDIWPVIGPQIEQVMSGGGATWHEDEYLPIERNGRLEDVWWTYGYSPVRDDDGCIAGTLVVCHETTSRVVAERERARLVESTRHAEDAALESGARLRAIFDGMYDYIGLLAPDGTLLEANRASLEFAGDRREDVVGRPFWETAWFASTPGAPAYMRDAVARAANGEFVRFEASMRRPSGEMLVFDVSLHPVRDAEGRVVYIVPEGRTIDERKRAENALRESERRYRTLFQSLDQGFCVIELLFDDAGQPVDYRFVEANPAFEDQSGMQQVLGRTVRELVPDFEQEWIDAYARVARSRTAARFEGSADSLGRWFDVYAFALGAPDDHRVAVLFKDITAVRAAAEERERLLRTIAVERSRLADVFRHAPSFIVAFRGPELEYEFVNDAYYQLVGHRDILGKPLLEALPEMRGQGFDTLLMRVMETGEPWVGRESPAELQRTPGAPLETRYLDMVFQALTDADGTRSGVVAHGTDVTEHVLARREVERLLVESERARAEADAARVAAEAADQSKSQFIANMSHELRTPLNAIQGHLQLLDLELHGPVTQEQRATFVRIDRAQRHLLGLVNDVLNYARLGSGQVEYRVEPLLVADVVNDVLPMVEPQLAVKGLSVEVRLPEVGPDGPTGLPAVPVLADREKLGQVFLNLLSNAIKFTDRGGHITVALTARADRSEPPDIAYFRVSDTGIGIPPDKLETIFEPFVQVRSEYARAAGGTGLGLAISRDLARGMGGDLRARSTPGSGSAFTITLRRVPV